MVKFLTDHDAWLNALLGIYFKQQSETLLNSSRTVSPQDSLATDMTRALEAYRPNVVRNALIHKKLGEPYVVKTTDFLSHLSHAIRRPWEIVPVS